MNFLLALSIIGLLISIYSKYIEKEKQNNKNYRALCDVSNSISCSAVLTSKYNKIFKIQNTILGILFYIIIIALAIKQEYNFIFILATLAFLFSLALAYIQFFKIKKFCFLCTLSYLINLLLAILSYSKI